MQYVPPLGATDPNAPYIEGNPAAGIRGSFPTAAGFSAMMNEIVNAIAGSGLTPDAGNLSQLLAAIQRIVAAAIANIPAAPAAPAPNVYAPGEGIQLNAGAFGLDFTDLATNNALSSADYVAVLQTVAGEGGQAASHHRKTSLATLASILAPLIVSASTAGYQGSFSPFGWAKFPDGLIFQWLSYGGYGHGPTNATLPIAFPNAVFFISATDTANQDGAGTLCFSYGLDFSSLTQVQVFSSAVSNAWHAHILAIGW